VACGIANDGFNINLFETWRGTSCSGLGFKSGLDAEVKYILMAQSLHATRNHVTQQQFKVNLLLVREE